MCEIWWDDVLECILGVISGVTPHNFNLTMAFVNSASDSHTCEYSSLETHLKMAYTCIYNYHCSASGKGTPILTYMHVYIHVLYE